MPFNISQICETVKGNFDDYRILKEYHYIISDPCCIRGIYKIRAKYPYTNKFPDPMGLIVYTAPIADLEPRHKATNNFFKDIKNNSVRISLTNDYIVYIARIIIEPRFHKQGLATKLLQDTIPLQKQPIIETLTPLDHTSRLFKKFGFYEFHNPTPPEYVRIQNVFKKYNIPPEIWGQPEIVQYRIDSLSSYKHAIVHKEMKAFLRKFKAFRYSRPGLTRTRYLLSKIIYPNAYQIRIDPEKLPNFKVNTESNFFVKHSQETQETAEKLRNNLEIRLEEPNHTKTTSRAVPYPPPNCTAFQANRQPYNNIRFLDFLSPKANL